MHISFTITFEVLIASSRQLGLPATNSAYKAPYGEEHDLSWCQKAHLQKDTL